MADRNTNGVFYCPMCTNAYAAAQVRDEHYAKVHTEPSNDGHGPETIRHLDWLRVYLNTHALTLTVRCDDNVATAILKSSGGAVKGLGIGQAPVDAIEDALRDHWHTYGKKAGA